jgi:carboxypeptidase C (cathepsin A)
MKHSAIHMLLSVFFICILTSGNLTAQEKKEEAQTPKPVPPPKEFVTVQQGVFSGVALKYKVIAGETYLKNDKEEPVASIWSTSYIKEGDAKPVQRPVMFIFNGGPGSASVWLHMGFFGPVIVKTDSEAKTDDGAAPYKIERNTKALLDLTDLVFIDPVGTGFSTVIGSAKPEDFWGLNEDANSIAQFIRLWVSKHKRWLSPKYIAGESFGTTRAATVTNALEKGGQSMALNGLILISQALDYEGSTSVHDNITSYITYLPSMAATAWYHKKAGQGKSLQDFLTEVSDFTYNEYVPALYKGNYLSEADRTKLASRLASYTGLPEHYVLQSDLKILMDRFQKELLRDQNLTIGRLDGRYMGKESDAVADHPTLGDPASYGIDAAYTAALNHYLSGELNVEMDRPYKTSNPEINNKWRWRTVPEGSYWEPMYVNVSRMLGDAMRRNKDLNVLVACGYYDLITPFFDAEYTFSRNGIPKVQIKLTYYEGGHMMYNHQPDFDKLMKDIREFLLNDLK